MYGSSCGCCLGWRAGEHSGTHINCASCFFPGGATAEQYAAQQLVGPLVRLDLRSYCAAFPLQEEDPLLQLQHLEQFEREHGRIAAVACDAIRSLCPRLPVAAAVVSDVGCACVRVRVCRAPSCSATRAGTSCLHAGRRHSSLAGRREWSAKNRLPPLHPCTWRRKASALPTS